MGYAQFCSNACAGRHSIAGSPTPAKGLRGPIGSDPQPGTTSGTSPQSAPVTVPETTPETTPGPTPETGPGNTSEPVPVVVPDTPESTPKVTPGTPEQQGTPAEQLGIPGSGQIQPGSSTQPGGQPVDRTTPQMQNPSTEPVTPGQSTGPGQTTRPEDGSTIEVWPTQKNLERPDQSTTPSTGGSYSGQTIQFPTGAGPVPDPQFYNNNNNQLNAPGRSNAIPLTPNDLSENGGGSNPQEPHVFTSPQLAFANVGEVDGGASQDIPAFQYTDASANS